MLYVFDDFELDAESLELRRSGTLLKVDALVLRLLLQLVRNAGRLVTKEELIEGVWEGRAIADNAITVSMARLRKTLGESRQRRELIATVYGRGYRFVQPIEVVAANRSDTAPRARPIAPELPFVGRDRALQRLLDALSEARLARGRLCLLLGEPGIGKTRLVEQLERSVRSDEVRVSWGYCREAGDTPPLWPWLRILREVTGHDWSDATSERAGELAGEASGARRRHELFDGIARALAAAAERAPWLLVLEDLHRADAASIELLSYLLDEIAHTRILIVATLRRSRARATLRPETHLPRVLGHRNGERIALDRLEPAAVSSYVAALLEDPDGELGRAVFNKSEGNPFFMAELARGLSGAAAPSAASLEVPDTALDLLRQRALRLEPRSREVLVAAAVIGRSFELPLLSLVLDREPSELMVAIDHAIADEIVIAAPGSMTAFAFGHDLQRAVLYDALEPREQRAWHLRVAEALAHKQAQGEPVPASELAFHSHAALPDGDLRLTVQRCRAAANAAALVFAIPDVIRYAQHALEALDLIPGASTRLRMSLLYQISAYSRGHNWSVVESSTRELTRLAREHGDGPMLARAASMLNVHPELKPLPGSSAAAEQALELLPAHDVALRGLALAQLACSAPRCYEREQSQALIEDAVAMARHSGDRNALDPALTWRMHLEGGPDREHAAAVCAEIEQLAHQGTRAMPQMPLMLCVFRATVALQRGELAAVELALNRAAASAQHLNHCELLWHVRRCQAMSLINQGALEEGRVKLADLHREAERAGILTTQPLCAFDRAVIFERTKAELGEGAWGMDGLMLDPCEPPSIWALKTRALSSAGFLDEARAALHMLAPGALFDLPCDSQYLGTLGQLARAALRLGASEYYEPLLLLLSRYPSYFSANLTFLCEGSMASEAGRLLLALGRTNEACAQLEAGLSAERCAGLSYAAAQTERTLDTIAAVP